MGVTSHLLYQKSALFSLWTHFNWTLNGRLLTKMLCFVCFVCTDRSGTSGKHIRVLPRLVFEAGVQSCGLRVSRGCAQG